MSKYSDSSETSLLDFFSQHPQADDEFISDFLNQHSNSWPLVYHLAPQRHFLLDWYGFKPKSSLLEIGAGCGAMTGLFLKKGLRTVANELEEERAAVIKKRFGDHKLLQIHSGSFDTLANRAKFDYCVVIGVLEYAGRWFAQSNNDYNQPYLNFLKQVKQYLKPEGTLLLAIENRLSMSYLTGSTEDHTGTVYNSVNNYPNYSGVRTFSKNELENLLKLAGFNNVKLYYPFPDYKMPAMIYSDLGLEKNLNIGLSDVLGADSMAHSNPRFFSTVSMLANNRHLIAEFANSFLVEVTL